MYSVYIQEELIMSKRWFLYMVIPALVFCLVFGCTGIKGPRPENIKYEKLDFKVPKPDEFRTTLSNGLVVYIAEDHEIPWFDASLMVKTGPFLEPANKIGVASIVPGLMREGGTKTMTGEQINERMDFLAGSVSATSLSVHMRDVDEGLKIWLDILNNPAFPDDKTAIKMFPPLPAARLRILFTAKNRPSLHSRRKQSSTASPETTSLIGIKNTGVPTTQF